MYRKFSPKKVKSARGDETLKAVTDRTGGKIIVSELSSYERGVYRPSDEKMAHLLKALNCTWEDISEPYSAETVGV